MEPNTITPPLLETNMEAPQEAGGKRARDSEETSDETKRYKQVHFQVPNGEDAHSIPELPPADPAMFGEYMYNYNGYEQSVTGYYPESQGFPIYPEGYMYGTNYDQSVHVGQCMYDNERHTDAEKANLDTIVTHQSNQNQSAISTSNNSERERIPTKPVIQENGTTCTPPTIERNVETTEREVEKQKDGMKHPPTEAIESAEESDATKCYKSGIETAIHQFVCPLTKELPLNPVMAEDGIIYERSAIEDHMRRQQEEITSPTTKEPMGPRLFSAVHARNAIKSLVNCGAVNAELAKKWKQQMMKAEINETAKRAKYKEDKEAMCKLGRWYFEGMYGLPKDHQRSYYWYKQAADLMSLRGLAEAGMMVVHGVGVEKNVPHGMSLITMAATRGSDLAAFNMAQWYRLGHHGLPQNKLQALHWYREIVDGKCKVKHLSEEFYNESEERLRKLGHK